MKKLFSLQINDQIVKVLWITIAWIIVSLFQFLIGLSILRQLKCDMSEYDPMVFFKGSMLTGLLAGIIGGTVLVFVWEKWLRSKTYGSALISIFLTYCIIYLVVAISTNLYFNANQYNLSVFSLAIWDEVAKSIFSIDQLQNFTFWLVIVLSTLIALQVNDKYGTGVFRSFILGKYFQPKREERIFMFLDLRSSTSIAEKLGEVQYFNFIKEVFQDVTPAIIYSRGEIYQYVGDEIVVSWKTDKGTENANCIRCFFDVQSLLQKRANYYKEHYDGVVPMFKAGLHYGHVMAGEIGVVKRDIAYSGDVLNTTARIQSKCNELGVDILLSNFLLEKLRLSPNLFNPKKMGDINLRGKQEQVVLYTV